MAITPVGPVPVLTKNGLNVHAWQRWFATLQEKVNSLITASSSVGTFHEVTGASIALVTATVTPLCALTLAAGEWDIEGCVEFQPGAVCSYSDLLLGVSQSSTAFGASPGTRTRVRQTTNTIGVAQTHQELLTPTVRMNLAASTTVYLVVEGAFTNDALSAIGYLRARSF